MGVSRPVCKIVVEFLYKNLATDWIRVYWLINFCNKMVELIRIITKIRQIQTGEM